MSRNTASNKTPENSTQMDNNVQNKPASAKTPENNVTSTIPKAEATIPETPENSTQMDNNVQNKPASAKTPEVQTAKKSSTVLVASKFQNALEFVINDSSGRPVTITINGNAENLRGQVKGILPFGAKAVGFTRLDADVWKKIVAKYKNNRLIVSGVVFAVSSEEEAYERKNIKTGLEPVDPKNTQSSPKK